MDTREKLRLLWLNIRIARLGGEAPMLKAGRLSDNLCTMLRLTKMQCQTCRARLIVSILPDKQNHPSLRTQGHLCSRADWGGGYRHWLTQCCRCNQDQGSMSYYHWLRHLTASGDPRARTVFCALMAMLQLRIPLEQLAPRGSRALPRRPICEEPSAQAAE